MAEVTIVDEKSSSFLTVSLFDKDDVLAIPTLLSYNIEEADDATSIRAETVITPASTFEIALNAVDNTILDDGKDYEEHRVTINAEYGPNDELHDDFIYKVRNLSAAADAI